MNLVPETLNFPIQDDLDSCLIKDRIKLQQRLQALKNRQRKGQAVAQDLLKIYKVIRGSRTIVEQRRTTTPTPEFPPDLPISTRWEEIGALIAQHQVIVLCGETGSGKSTQLPKICLALGRGITGRIGHTQPRRIAARSLATRIAQELNRPLGTTVGYKVRFQDHVRPETQIKLMTDGMLLAEIPQDRHLYEYDTLILDEAHERSLNIDFLLGYLKQLLPRRPELKLIITSATIDPERFAQHFNNAPIVEVSGRTYPVETRYRPVEDDSLGERDDEMQQAICAAVDELSLDGRGDILIFLSGEREIRETADTLRKYRLPATEILPLYARLGTAEQGRIFEPHGTRHIVLATNVAETSLTVPGIHYVIDTGLARISRYSPRSKVQRLPIERISQSAAEQRKGRCGRVAAGICIRLYTEDNFVARRGFTEPEIQRTNLAAVILQMRVLGFGEVEAFPFLEPPDLRLIADGYRLLAELQAVDAERQVTPLGHKLARLPVDPRIGRMLLAAVETRCLAEVLVIAAALSVQDPRERPLEQQAAADAIHTTFNHEESDFLSLLNLWRFLEQERNLPHPPIPPPPNRRGGEQTIRSKNQMRTLCRQYFLSWTRVLEWQDTYQQLKTLLHEQGMQEDQTPAGYDAVHRALLTGLLGNIGLRDEEQGYQGVRNGRFWVHPSSGQFKHMHKWIMAAERVQTTKDYGRTVAKINPDWIEQMGAHLVERTYSEPHWQAERGQVAAFEKVSLLGLVLVAQRRVNYGPINPAEARAVFIRGALVNREFTTQSSFFRHNQELIDTVKRLEAKARRLDLLVDDEIIQAFYEARIAPCIASTPAFESWLREVSPQDPKRLHMRLSDLLQPGAEVVGTDQFPDHLEIGGASTPSPSPLSLTGEGGHSATPPPSPLPLTGEGGRTTLPLEYRFEPGHPEDGITLVIPLSLINQVPSQRCEWLVPGLMETLVTFLLRGLPKSYRKLFMPIPDTATRLMQRLKPTDRPLLQGLGEALFKLTGTQVPEDAWDMEALPEYLRMGFRIVDNAGRTLAWDRNFSLLRRTYGQQGRKEFANISSTGFEKMGIIRWDFGELPETIRLKRNLPHPPAPLPLTGEGGNKLPSCQEGIEGGRKLGELQGYPALVDQGTSVALRIMDAPERALVATRAGLRRLALLQLPADARQIRKGLTGLSAMRLHYAKITGVGDTDTALSASLSCQGEGRGGVVVSSTNLEDELIARIVDRAIFAEQPLPRTDKAFTACLNSGRAKLVSTTKEVRNLAKDILIQADTVRTRIAALNSTQWELAINDMQWQLNKLFYPGFLRETPDIHLRQYPRYLSAMQTRLARLPGNAARDSERILELWPVLTEWQLRHTRDQATEYQDPRLEEIGWMLEELRISLFAQPQPTAYPISIQRLEKRWRDLGL